VSFLEPVESEALCGESAASIFHKNNYATLRGADCAAQALRFLARRHLDSTMLAENVHPKSGGGEANA
jgi:hypothetical protein